MNKYFKQKYEVSVWTDIGTFNLKRNMNIQFTQIYEQSVQTDIWTIDSNRYVKKYF